MKIPSLLSAAYICLLLATTGCQTNSCRDEVVCETYVHRYGVPLQANDWSARGQHGQVVSTRRDGVVVSKTYESGILQGETTYTFPHREVIQRKEVYCQGELSQASSYYPNGMPQQQIIYDSGNHSMTAWYEGGVPQCKEEYEQGHLVRGSYYNLSNHEESRVEDREGTRTRRDAYGQLISVDSIQNGQMTMCTTYHPNGTPAALTPYVNGVVEGKRRTFTVGGEPATIEEWTNNTQHGNTEIFDNGEKCADMPYINGRPHGVEYRYRDNDTVVQRRNWIQGKKHGPCYNYVGNTTQTDWYFQGRQVNKPTYDMLSNQ